MKKLLLTLAVMLSFTSANAADTVKKYGEAYKGEKNELVEVAYVEGKDAAYVYVSGVNNKIDGKVQYVTIVNAGSGKDFKTSSGSVLMSLRDSGYGSSTAELYLPGEGKTTPLNYDKDASTEFDTPRLVTMYGEQKK